MNSLSSFGPPVAAVILGGLVLGSAGCRKAKQAAAVEEPANAAVISAELKSNGLVSLPGAVYRSQAGSPIHWQPWAKESFSRAKDANRLVFAVIALPQQPGFQTVLDTLAKDDAVVKSINESYVPVVVDGDASREMGLLTADLCAEIARGLQLPLFVWFSADGNPVAWIPITQVDNVLEMFNQSDSMVKRMWADDSGYVERNSALDNEARIARFAERKNAKVMTQTPAEDAVKALRQLTSFYDPDSRSFDEAGGLFPSGAIDLLATAAVHPGISPDVRARCLDTTRELMKDLMPSAMFDPLEGGIFSSRRGAYWSFPAFTKDCGSQARAAVSLLRAYKATGDIKILDKALGLISFAEKAYLTPDGLFSSGLSQESEIASWLWRVEDIEKELPAEDAAWWIKATGMKGLGNLPSEVDPRREFFRLNSMGLGRSVPEIAADLSISPEVFAPRFELARKKLLGVRNARLGNVVKDNTSYATATFRMVSAYAAAFSATGDDKYRKSATELLAKSKEAFSAGPRLRMFTKPAPDSVGAARAFVYGLAIQASLDVGDITSEETWVSWAENLATTSAELFTGEGFLKECPEDAKIVNLPVADSVMLFDDSTAGLISFAECRLAGHSRQLLQSLSDLATPLPSYAVDRPILHTDLIQAIIARHYGVSIVMGAEVSPELKRAVERLPLRMFQRRAAGPKDEVPANSVKVTLSSGEPRNVSTPEALEEVLLPSSRN